MSLYGALFTGVSGLNANSRALGVASNNIANVSTTGYKANETQFATLLPSTSLAGGFTSGGVRANPIAVNTKQGLLQPTENATDVGINGNGFFVVTDSPENAGTVRRFTRAGAFSEDANGDLRNPAGYYLLGWRLDAQGKVPSNRNTLSPINIKTLTGTAEPTSEMTLRANLRASQVPVAAYAAGDINAGTVTPHFERTIEIYDTQGGAQPVRLSFVKTAPNTWNYEVIFAGNVANIGGAASNPIATGTVTFNSDGTLATPASGTTAVTVPWAAVSGLQPQDITLDFGTAGLADGMTQFDSASALIASQVNGALFGGISGVRIDDEGYMTALFDNGVQRRVFKLPLATFQNPNGLVGVNGNAFNSSDESGTASLLEAGTGGAGSISASSLESSTVDLAKEFTDLITTQRAYSAATRIITTADQMLEEVSRLKR